MRFDYPHTIRYLNLRLKNQHAAYGITEAGFSCSGIRCIARQPCRYGPPDHLQARGQPMRISPVIEWPCERASVTQLVVSRRCHWFEMIRPDASCGVADVVELALWLVPSPEPDVRVSKCQPHTSRLHGSIAILICWARPPPAASLKVAYNVTSESAQSF